MPADPLGPYRSTDDATAARLESSPDAGDYRRRQGFFAAAVLLLEGAVGAEHWLDRDPLIWPGLYSFRHFVELTLKMLARDTPMLVTGDVPMTHLLHVLWEPVREGFEEVFPDDDPDDPIGVIEQALAVLGALDPAGDGLRYATTRKGAPSIPQDVYLDPQALMVLIREVESVFEAAESAFDDRQNHLRETREAFGTP
jgi:hypothetical protein